jgi:hypothetical protein
MAKRKRRSSGKRAQNTQEAIEEFKAKFDALDDKRKKHTTQAIERRRHDVWEMMCQDIPQTEMAGLLHVARSTIALDVQWWKRKMARRVGRIKSDPDHANVELGLTVRKLDSLNAAAFQEYAMAKSASEKAKFLDIATKTLSTKIRILQEAGYMPKAGIEIRAKIEQLPTFADRFGEDSALSELDDATKRHKLLAMAERFLRLSEQPDTIDAKHTAAGPGFPREEPTPLIDMQNPPSNA